MKLCLIFQCQEGCGLYPEAVTLQTCSNVCTNFIHQVIECILHFDPPIPVPHPHPPLQCMLEVCLTKCTIIILINSYRQ